MIQKIVISLKTFLSFSQDRTLTLQVLSTYESMLLNTFREEMAVFHVIGKMLFCALVHLME